jgi:O-antigen/teichoic acid export membrane protein
MDPLKCHRIIKDATINVGNDGAIEASNDVNAFFRRGWEWIHLFGTTAAAQAATQVLGFAAGLIIVRTLPPAKYALYVLSLTIVGAMNVLADSGITDGVMAEGGKQWRDRVWLGQVVATGRKLRFQFARIATCILIPTATWLLVKHGASWATAGFLILAIIANFLLSLSVGLYSIPPALHQQVFASIKISLRQSIIRLCLTAILLLAFPNPFVAMMTAVVAQYFVLGRIKKLGMGYIDHHQKSSDVIETKILKLAKRRFPDCLYYCISGQISIWLATLYGSTIMIAQIGALGRIGQLMLVLSSITSMVLVPRFARLANNHSLVIKRYFQAQLVLGLFVGLVCIAIVIFSKECLWLLGASYAGLGGEIILMAVGAGANVLSTAAFAMNMARGYVPNPVAYIGLNVLWQVLCIKWLNVGSVTGMFEFGIAIPLFNFFILSAYAIYSAYRAESAT